MRKSNPTEQGRPRHVVYLLVGLLNLTLLGAALTRADEAPPGTLPPEVERLVGWLPEDTETLYVARSVSLDEKQVDVNKPSWSDLGRLLVGDGTLNAPAFAPIKKLRLSLVVEGGRHYEIVSSFGSLRSESCAIFQLEKPLAEEGQPFVAGLRKSAQSIRELVGREVFVFPSTIVKEPWIRQKPWEGSYYVLLDPSTLLIATSDRYLEETLKRVNSKAKGRALPRSLREWKWVNLAAPVWILRHFPRVGSDHATIGTTASFTDVEFEVTYIPGEGKVLDMNRVERQWFDSKTTLGQRRKFPLVRHPDGTIQLSTKTSPEFEADASVWLWQISRLLALDLFHYR